jgi:hypothetical protein
MKHLFAKNLLVVVLTCLTLQVSLLGQSKTASFELGDNEKLNELIPDGYDGFFSTTFIYGTFSNIPKGARIVKFNSALEPIWKEPVKLDYIRNCLTYVDTTTNKTTDYLYYNQNFYRVGSDGVSQQLELKIPKKAWGTMSSVFVDEKGLNIIMMKGDREFRTGEQHWYTIGTNETSTSTPKIIKLPLPKGIDVENDSDWRLNAITSSGIYFCYIGYKNVVKDNTYPILNCFIIKVDNEGKAGNMMELPIGLDKYTILPADFQHYRKGLEVRKPDLFFDEPDIQTTTSGGRVSTRTSSFDKRVYNDLGRLGVSINEANDRIYLVTLNNEDMVIDKNGNPKIEIGDSRYAPVKSMTCYAYDLNGKKIGISTTPIKQSKIEIADTRYNDFTVNLYPLDNKEGIAVKFINNSKGSFEVFDSQAKHIESIPTNIYFDNKLLDMKYVDVFNYAPKSLSELRNAPYAKPDASPASLFFNKLNKDEKRQCYSTTTKNKIVIGVHKYETNKIEFTTFDKK